MRTLVLAFLLLVPACGNAIEPGDAGDGAAHGDAATRDVAPLNMDETELLGTWVQTTPAWTIQLEFMPDRTLRETHEINEVCGAHYRFVNTRTWSAIVTALHFDAGSPCEVTVLSDACALPNPVDAYCYREPANADHYLSPDGMQLQIGSMAMENGVYSRTLH